MMSEALVPPGGEQRGDDEDGHEQGEADPLEAGHRVAVRGCMAQPHGACGADANPLAVIDMCGQDHAPTALGLGRWLERSEALTVRVTGSPRPHSASSLGSKGNSSHRSQMRRVTHHGSR